MLVVGAGPIGIAASIFAKAQGAEVFVVDMNARRLAFCSDKIGVDHAIEVSADVDERLETATGGDFFDIVIDAIGSPKAMMKGFSYVGHGGTYILLLIVQADIRFNDPEFHKRETSLLSSRNATRHDFKMVINAMHCGNVPLPALGSHCGGLEEAPVLIPNGQSQRRASLRRLLKSEPGLPQRQAR